MDLYLNKNDNINVKNQSQYENAIKINIEKIVKNCIDKDVSAGYIDSLHQFILHFTKLIISRDLIEFSQHGGRKIINEEDIILISRKTKYYNHLKSLKEFESKESPNLKKFKQTKIIE